MKVTVLPHNPKTGTLAINNDGLVLLTDWRDRDATRIMFHMKNSEMNHSIWEADIEMDKFLNKRVFIMKSLIQSGAT